MSYSTRSDVKQLAQVIEGFAHTLTSKLDSGKVEDFLPLANELVRNSSTLTFALGEVYASEQLNGSKKVSAKVVKSGTSTPTNVNRNYHNVRDSRGRFVPKV